MKCLIKSLDLWTEDVILIDGVKHTFLYEEDGAKTFRIGGGYAEYGLEVEVEFGGWVGRPTVDFLNKVYNTDVTKWEDVH